jgi:midasin (ATPase involved in ribosome maturation)
LVGLLQQALDTLSPHVKDDERREIAQIQMRLNAIQELATGSRGRMSCFEWVDGVLLHALEAGHWLLLDNVNFCSASVLDRLNSLLEIST